MRRRSFVLAALPIIGLGLGVAQANAATDAPFTPDAFAAAQKAGKPILLHITAPWCPTCTAQKPILGKIAVDAAFKDLVILRIDFDNQKDVVRAMNVRTQSTLIAYRGADEVGRSAGDTNETSIIALARKSIG